MNNCNLIILTFIVTGLWDLVLQFINYNYDKMPDFIKWFDFIKSLDGYFKQHTILSAVLLAGFIGAITQIIILSFYNFPKNIKQLFEFLIITFIISGLIGFPIQKSNLFPILNSTYYKYLGNFRGFYHDGISGIIVQITLFIILNGQRYIR